MPTTGTNVIDVIARIQYGRITIILNKKMRLTPRRKVANKVMAE